MRAGSSTTAKTAKKYKFTKDLPSIAEKASNILPKNRQYR
jgi:hypothetical protein